MGFDHLERPLIAAAFVAALFAPAFPCRAESAGAGQTASWTNEQKETFLRTARIVNRRPVGEGVTHSERATLTNDTVTHDAHIQSIDEFKHSFQTDFGTEFNFRDTYKFNIAAYKLDRMLDMNMIPVSVERMVGNHNSAVTWWVDNVAMTELQQHERKAEAPDRNRWEKQMWVRRVFDQLIYNTDRNLGNLLITKDWDVWLIDHTRAFRTSKDLKPPVYLDHCDRYLLKKMRELDRANLETEMKHYLGKAEIDALLARRDKLVKAIDKEIAEKSESAVLFDYLEERKSQMQASSQPH